MSITNYREPEEHRPQYGRALGAPNIESDDTFKDVIQRDPCVCNNCFTDRFDVEAVEWWCGSLGWLDWERFWPIAGRNDPDPNRNPSVRGGGEPVHCANCGFGGVRNRPLSMHQATEYAANLSRALDTRDVDHDTEVLLREVRRRKRDPDAQGKDDAIFAPAVTRACQVT